MVTSLRTIILMAARNLATCPRSSCKNSYRNEMEKKLMLVKRLKTRGREVQQQEYAENALIRDSDLSGGRGGSRIFFRRGCSRLLLYFNTNKPHSFLFFLLQNTSCIRKPQVISGGGVRTPCTLPLDPSLRWIAFEQLGPGV